ncbi:hypothetical protein SAY86_005332 [Trapa natans]|uniref:Uncharacterized protein n=1 Tax=Trapa natans TaxID=22666 RepID=A0AAN7QRC5_TRANT|nr:hypothetical protein SAY86_005332 [Trapa natans]
MGIENRKRKRESLDRQEHPSPAVGSDGKKAVRKGKGREEEKEAEAGASPIDEEVEEFFAIVRRMGEAVKYLRREGYGMGGTGRPWDTILKVEAEAAAAVDGGEENEEESDNRVEKDRIGNIMVEDQDNEGAAEVDGDCSCGGSSGGRLLDLNNSPKDDHGGD